MVCGMSLTVTHEPDADRYAAYDGDELQGWIIYDNAGGTLRLLHAEVPPLKRGQGVGGAVVQAILQELRAYGVSPIDVIPELLVGPLGFGDDLAVLAGAGFAIWKLLSGRDPRQAGPGSQPGSAPSSQPEPHYEQKPRPEQPS